MADVALRECSESDSDRLFVWRRADHVNRWMFSDPPKTRSSHDAWFAAQLLRTDKWMWIIESGRLPVGLVSLERTSDPEILSLGIYVAEKSVKGSGRHALESVISIAEARELGRTIRAEVFFDNLHAISLYESVGFVNVSPRIASMPKAGNTRDIARFELSLSPSRSHERSEPK